jgi:divalent metal cation (Fe/Co/Zn/Cd) transporter
VPSPLLEFFHAHGVGEHDHGHAHAAAEVLTAGAEAGAVTGVVTGADALAGADPLSVGHAHGHETGALLNPHAAWFALASVLVKEWLYQLTNKVAKEENSPVLKANALQ